VGRSDLARRLMGTYRHVGIGGLLGRRSEPCTGVAASWCPNCGTCTCVEYAVASAFDCGDYPPVYSFNYLEELFSDRELDDPNCPLHDFLSPHAD
jgi:hypothetical protein